MNPQQHAFYRQALSDWETFRYLRHRGKRIECHELHYLQMATEKLAKAYLWGTKTPPRQVHASFIQFLRRAATDARIRRSLNVAQQSQFEEWIRSSLPLARAVEMLSPGLAQNGPNPEYPWPPALPMVAPVDHDFAISGELDAAKGRKLIDLIGKLFSTFEQWA